MHFLTRPCVLDGSSGHPSLLPSLRDPLQWLWLALGSVLSLRSALSPLPWQQLKCPRLGDQEQGCFLPVALVGCCTAVFAVPVLTAGAVTARCGSGILFPKRPGGWHRAGLCGALRVLGQPGAARAALGFPEQKPSAAPQRCARKPELGSCSFPLLKPIAGST